MKKRYLSILLALSMLAACFAPLNVFAAESADIEADILSDGAETAQGGEVQANEGIGDVGSTDDADNTGAAVAAEGTPTELDISLATIIISATGASGGGLATSETELNPDGYRITGTTTANTIVVSPDVSTKLIFDNLSISSTAKSSAAVDLRNRSDVYIEIVGENTVTISGTGSVGIGLRTEAKVHISGSGSLDVRGYTAGIGMHPYSAANPNALIEINGGTINASSSRGPGIGTYKSTAAGEVRITAGSVTATGYASSGGIRVAKTDKITIIGGSVHATTYGVEPVNEVGTAVKLIEVEAENCAGAEFIIPTASGVLSTAIAESDIENTGKGYLYLYVPADSENIMLQRTLDDGSTDMYMVTVDWDEVTAKRKLPLKKYTGARCSCTEENASLVFEGQKVVVNETTGEQVVLFSVEFVPAENCAFQAHNIVGISYRFTGDVPTTDEAEILSDNTGMAVRKAAAGKTLTVEVTATVNDVVYTKTAAFEVTSADNYEFDISKGNITISANTVTVGGTTYQVPNTSKPIRIYQSGAAENKKLTIETSVTRREVILDNINITQPVRSMESIIKIAPNASVTFTLQGENSVIMNQGEIHPAISVGVDSTLTFGGSGSITAKGGNANVGIGGGKDTDSGNIIIKSGKIIAIGGEKNETDGLLAAPGIGSRLSSTRCRIMMEGGALLAKGGEGSDMGDINAAVTVDGGSIMPDASRSEVRFNNSSLVNSQQKPVYLTKLGMEGISEEKNIKYYVQINDGSEGTAVSTALDSRGMLYLYFPADENWRRIRATVDGDESGANYYKRMKISDETEKNERTLVTEPQGYITSFYIVGQSSSEVDESTKTITVKVKNSVDLTNIEPVIIAKDSREASGGELEYTPTSAVDFQTDPDAEHIFSVILDDGSKKEYKVVIERVESGEPDEKTVLDISAGNIIMEDDETITIGNSRINPNPNGYIITGESDEHYIIIGEINVPIEFNNLVIDKPELSLSRGEYPLAIFDPSVDISVTGVNSISAQDGSCALYIMEGAGIHIDGDGILTLQGGTNANALVSESSDDYNLVIDGVSVFTVDGEGAAPGADAYPKGENGEKLYPVIVTLNEENAKNAYVTYGEIRYDETGETEQEPAVSGVKLLMDGEGRVSVFRPLGCYSINITLDKVVYYSEEKIPLTDERSASNPLLVTVQLPGITGLKFKDPLTAHATELSVSVEGGNLGGDITVTATGEGGETVSAKAVKDADDNWSATLSIPANEKYTKYRWTLSADIGGIEQINNIPFDMWGKLEIKSFELEHQVSSTFEDESADKKKISVLMPYDADLSEPRVPVAVWEASGVNPPLTGKRNFNSPITYRLSHVDDLLPDDEISKDRVTYTVTAANEETPVVTGISFTQPADYRGGAVEITLTGDNLENITHAIGTEAKRITVTAGSLSSVYVTAPDANGAYKATVNIPDNTRGLQTAHYPIKISINGVEQEFTPASGDSEIIVPARIELLATINSFGIQGMIGNAVIDHSTDNLDGRIDIVMPNGTDPKYLNAEVVLTNQRGTKYRLLNSNGTPVYNPRGDINGATVSVSGIDFTDPVTLEVTSELENNVKKYIIHVAVEEQSNPRIKSFEMLGQKTGSFDHSRGDGSEGGEINIVMPNGTDPSQLKIKLSLVGLLASYKLYDCEGREIYDSEDERSTGANDILLPLDFEQPVGPLDFTAPSSTAGFIKPIVLSVTSQDGSENKEYNINVRVEEQDNPYVESFDIVEQISSDISHEAGENENHGTIDVKVKGGANLEELLMKIKLVSPRASYTLSDKDGNEISVTPSEEQEGAFGPIDFSDEVTLTVTSQDKTASRQYIVTVKRRRNNNDEEPIVEETQVSAYINGYEDYTFRPDAKISRAEAAAMIARLDPGFDPATPYNNNFADVPKGIWYENSIAYLATSGVMSGYEDGSMKPTRQITRMEFAAMLARLEGKVIAALSEDGTATEFSDILGLWGEEQIILLARNGIINGYEDETFRPNSSITRAEAVAMLNRALGRMKGKDEDVTKKLQAALREVILAQNCPFDDISESHWAYFDIMLAVNDYTVTATSKRPGPRANLVTQIKVTVR